MSNDTGEEKHGRYPIDTGLAITIIIFLFSLYFNILFYAIASAAIFYVGIHTVRYFKNSLEYSKEILAETGRQNELLLELIRERRNDK